jgi:tRNA nucleotidyltransferase/poly(A) polymerase
MDGTLAIEHLGRLREHPVCEALLALDEPPDVAVVGGTVRDVLLGRLNPDLDLVVADDPAGLAGRLREKLGGTWFVLDAEFGAVRLMTRNGGVDIVIRHGDSWDADLRRRDLTINALGVVLAEGGRVAQRLELRDPTGGAGDLAGRVIRAVSRENLAEDPVRVVRVFRFSATLDYAVDPQTKAWAAELAPKLAHVSAERVRDELVKILARSACAAHVAALAETGILEAILPELSALRGLASTGHFDAFAHRLEAQLALDALLARPRDWEADLARFVQEYLDRSLAGGRPVSSLLRLAGLAEGVAGVGHRLRLGDAETKWVHRASRGLAAFRELGRPTGADLVRFFRAAGSAAPGSALLGLADYLAARDLTLDDDSGARACARIIIREAMSPGVTAPGPPLLRGNEIASVVGLPPGPEIAALVQELAEARADGLVATPEEARDWLAARKKTIDRPQ